MLLAISAVMISDFEQVLMMKEMMEVIVTDHLLFLWMGYNNH